MSNLFKRFFAKNIEPIIEPMFVNRSKELLMRDLNNCYTLDEISKLVDVFGYAKTDMTIQEQIDFGNEINYRKKLINWVDINMPAERYSDIEIKQFFKHSISYVICDAILLHLQKNERFYTSEYINKETLDRYYAHSNLDCFITMSRNAKEIHYLNFIQAK